MNQFRMPLSVLSLPKKKGSDQMVECNNVIKPDLELTWMIPREVNRVTLCLRIRKPRLVKHVSQTSDYCMIFLDGGKSYRPCV